MSPFVSQSVSSAVALALGSVAVAQAQQTASAEIQEVIVTAARVSESLQTTALAIQAISDDDMIRRGATTPEELGKLVPSMNITSGGLPVIYLRGLGSQAANGFGQNGTSFNIDGVALAQQSALGGNFYDLERLEVLKGPQGTLYGRNSSVGALNVVTRSPTQELGGNVNIEIGNYNLARVTGALNVPVSDTLSLRGAIYSSERDGYMDDGFDDEDVLSGRFKALWTPSDSVQLLLAYSETNLHGKGNAVSPRPAPGGDFRLGPTNPLVSAFLVNSAAGAPPTNPAAHTDVVNHLVYAQLDWDLGFATLTYLPAYSWAKNCLGCDAAILPAVSAKLLGTHSESHQLTNELRLANQGESISYVAGLYVFDEHLEMDNLYYPSRQAGSSLQNVEGLDTESYAVFGEVTYSLSESLRLIGGLRYTDDKKTAEGQVTQAGPGQRIFGLGPDPVGIGDGIGPGITTGIKQWPMNNEGSSNRTNWKAGVEYDLTDRSFLFATVATGYKGAIFDPGPAPDNLSDPEYVTAYTLGSKNRFLNNSLQVNAEAFYWDFKGQQISGIGLDRFGSLNVVTYNAGASTSYGINLDVVWRITPSDMFRANFEYDHAYYDDYQITSPLPFTPGSNGRGCPLSTTPGGPFGTINIADCSGKQMIFAPTWTGNFAYGHDFTIGAGNTLHAEVSGRFTSEYYIQQDWEDPKSQMSGYTVWDALLEYSFADRPWSVGVWGRNLGDKVIFTSANAATVPGVFRSGLQAPRTFGLRFNMSF